MKQRSVRGSRAPSPTTASRSRPREEHAPARLRAATREAIIQAGTRAFVQHGLSGAKISLIARDAGVANGTFYLHFRDKEELYRAIVETTLKQLATQLQRLDANHLERDEAERAEIDAVISFIEAHEVVFQMAATADSEAGRPVTRMFVARRMRALKEGQRLGTVRADIRTDIAAYADIGMMISALRWWLGEGRGTPRDELIETLTTLRRFGTAPTSASARAMPRVAKRPTSKTTTGRSARARGTKGSR
jgi:AcrR family transcriptional regulator